MPFEPKVHMKRDETPLPEDLAALAAQLSNEADSLAATYPCASESALFEAERQAVAVHRKSGLRSYWSITRVAALLAVAMGATLGALWQIRSRDTANLAVRELPQPSLAKHLDAVGDEIAAVTQGSGRMPLPTFISIEAAEGLSGEEIEVLADAFAGQVAEL
jgi:hypothetical protein